MRSPSFSDHETRRAHALLKFLEKSPTISESILHPIRWNYSSGCYELAFNPKNSKPFQMWIFKRCIVVVSCGPFADKREKIVKASFKEASKTLKGFETSSVGSEIVGFLVNELK